MTTEQLAQQERGRRGRRREMTTPAPTIAQRPFTQLKRPYPSVALISDDQVEHIHQASLKLLSETGLDVLPFSSHHGRPHAARPDLSLTAISRTPDGYVPPDHPKSTRRRGRGVSAV